MRKNYVRRGLGAEIEKIVWGRRRHPYFSLLLRNLGPQTPRRTRLLCNVTIFEFSHCTWGWTTARLGASPPFGGFAGYKSPLRPTIDDFPDSVPQSLASQLSQTSLHFYGAPAPQSIPGDLGRGGAAAPQGLSHVWGNRESVFLFTGARPVA